MGRVISILNEKGGVGKTTTCSSLGSILSSRGFKVIMLDLDPQNDLTLCSPVDPTKGLDIFSCLFEYHEPEGIRINENLILIPGSENLQPLNFADKLKMDKEYQFENPRLILKLFLSNLKAQSDFILIDCPPNQEIVVQNALAASDYSLIPTMPHSFSLNGINSVLRLIQKFRKLNSNIEPLGVLMNSYDQRNSIDQAVWELCQQEYSDLIFKTPIRINTKMKEHTHLSIEITEYARQLSERRIPQKFSGYEDFQLVADELLSRLKMELNHVE